MSTLAAPFRRWLAPLGHVYGAVMRLRNHAFERGWLRVRHLPVRVVAVGNLSVGGTGKTPLVAWLVACARSRGVRVGVVARGYGRAKGARLNDEGELLARRFPELPQEQDPDRVVAIERLLAREPVDLVLLDDGFQHRRVHRDLDVVCVDATRPLERERILPAGDLRESASGLWRADVVVLTRAEAVAPAQIERQIEWLRSAARRRVTVFVAEHTPSDIVRASDGGIVDPSTIAAVGVELLSSIARPGSFLATARALGLRIVREHVYPDHHRHERAAIERLVQEARARGHVVLTTEKDIVKMTPPPADVLVLRIDLRFRSPEPSHSDLGIP
ncbi:MAG: tetraacyldisaccharide 4'-kinase [Planctomycetota bacterium]